MPEATPIVNNPDFSVLAGRDEYTRYLNLLSVAAKRLMAGYSLQAKNGNEEAGTINGYLQKLLYTINLLRVKYTHDPSHFLRVDLSASGFPNSLEIRELEVDLQQRQEKLKGFTSQPVLKRAILDHMFAYAEDPALLLEQAGQRRYFELLDPARMFLVFTPGELQLRSENEQFRNYLFSWGCYDFATNLPFVVVMGFDQDKDEQPLEELGESWKQFISVVCAEGSRQPNIGILALAIDEALVPIHPKILKRFRIGPLYSMFLMEKRDGSSDDPREQSILKLMSECGPGDDDFVLFIEDEIVFSKAQTQVKKSFWSKAKSVREIFFFPETNLEFYRRQASIIHSNVLLPHSLWQHLDSQKMLELLGVNDPTVFAYNGKGEIVHG